jgi:hypothetical protein
MEITQAIIGAAIKIQSSLGPGLLEDACKVCLAHALRLNGHKVFREVYLDIEWWNQEGCPYPVLIFSQRPSARSPRLRVQLDETILRSLGDMR